MPEIPAVIKMRAFHGQLMQGNSRHHDGSGRASDPIVDVPVNVLVDKFLETYPEFASDRQACVSCFGGFSEANAYASKWNELLSKTNPAD